METMETANRRRPSSLQWWPVLIASLALFGWPISSSSRWQVAASSPFTLEGSLNSYAQLRKWNAALNGTLQLEFRSTQPSGLLIYTDDGGKFDFFELKLVEGALRLRYNLGAGAQILTVGRNLSDGHWHNVTMKRNGDQTALTVDHVTVTRASRGKEFNFGNLVTNSAVYVGGLPAWYGAELTRLALPSVLFEPRYRGDLRNVIYSDAVGQHPRQQEILESQGVRVSQFDMCVQHDPCQHGGICINTDTGPVCECRNLDYDGPFCEKAKQPPETTLRGHEYFFYDMAQSGGEPIVSSSDEVSLYFKTRQATGMLFYTGDGEDYLALTLRDGAVTLNINLGSGKLDVQIRPPRVRFDDNQWHRVNIHRKAQEISGPESLCHLVMTVDGIHSERWTTAGTFSMLSSSRLFVGGADPASSLPGLRTRNDFIGCLRKVEFTADSLRLDILELARTGNKLLSVAGRPDWMCQAVEVADPITFTTPDTVLMLPSWEAMKTGSMSFKIRTNEPNGLLLYNNGAPHAQGDYFAVELVNGHVYLHLDLGSGSVKVKATSRRIDDGTWHEITISRNGKSGRATVDGASTDFVTPGDSYQLELDGSLMVGGIGMVVDNAAIPSGLWSATLRHGYVGCMRDLVINGNAVDLAAFARQQDSGAIRPACHVLPPQCESQPCMNGGTCTEGWNRFLCDCSSTSFNGPTCGKDAATLSFDGNQHFRVAFDSPSRSEAEDWRLRFRTPKPSGLLLTTIGDSHSHGRVELDLEGGRLRFTQFAVDRPKTWFIGQGLNDNQWHQVSISRRGGSIRMTIDDEPPVQGELTGRQATLETRALLVGSNLKREDIGSGSTTSMIAPSGQPNFVGQIQQLYFNGVYLIDMARSGQLGTSANVTAKFGAREQSIHHPVNFKSKHTYVGLPQLKAYSSTNIYFQFKTLEPKGVILYNAGKGQDFIGIELVNGHIHYAVNLGDGPIRIRDNLRNSLNDNRWHSVTIGRPGPRQHTLMVDDSISTVISQGHNENLDLNGILYLGGVRKDMYNFLPRQMQSRHGFEGCLASLDLNGESPDTTLDALVPSPLVVPGCEDSVAFEFGPKHGVLIYNFPEDRRPDSKSDILAFGFITVQENAQLIRITSASSNDFLELTLVDGHLYSSYNVGTDDHSLGEVAVKVNDGEHHVVRLTRSSANATLQVDDYNVQTKNPGGRQRFIFNSQSQIHVGGSWNEVKSKVDRPFVGIIAGLVFNGIRVLDLAAERDPRIQIRGDIELLTSIPADYRQRFKDNNQSMQRAPESAYPNVVDDLVFSGAGSGCVSSTVDDECIPSYNTGRGDDLITPVFSRPTRPPKPKPTIVVAVDRPCDDEDNCYEGSGSDPLVTDEPVNQLENEISTESTTTTTLSTIIWQTNRMSSSTSVTSSNPTTTITVNTTPSWMATTRPTMRTTSTTTTSRYPAKMYPTPAYPSFPSPATPRNRVRTTIDNFDLIWQKANREEMEKKRDFDEKSKRMRDRISSETAENTALIIGIVAGALIAVVAVILVVLLVLKLKSPGNTAYKIDERKNFSKTPSHSNSNAALLNTGAAGAGGVHGGGLAGTGMAGGQMKVGSLNLNPAMVNLEKKSPPSKKCGKDIKEWYV
uniref:Neurexin-2-beta n=1 Tax=Daphnia magna TaxID=35525 RepID=A0A0P4XQR9_9CRUS